MMSRTVRLIRKTLVRAMMMRAIMLHDGLERVFPERRVFIRSSEGTKFILLKPGVQVLTLAGGAVFFGWAAIATATVLMDSITSDTLRDKAAREMRLYEERLNILSAERDLSVREAHDAQKRFNTALEQISALQSALLASEDRREELETGIDVIQGTLQRTLKKLDAARTSLRLADAAPGSRGTSSPGASLDAAIALNHLTAAVNLASDERDTMTAVAAEAKRTINEMQHDQLLQAERNDAIFAQLEKAVSVSMAPLDKMFSSVGLSSGRVLDTVRRGYSSQSESLRRLRFSTKGAEPDSLRAEGILEKLDRINLYRIAVQNTPFALPIKRRFRYSSGFGPRWGRMHYGTDMVAGHGTPIHTSADGVVTYAGWLGNYGRLVKIRHQFGLETRYAHLSKIRVKVGQRVSHGDQIGDMGNTGRSTGTHLHYEIRTRGKPVDPMTYIKAAKNVF